MTLALVIAVDGFMGGWHASDFKATQMDGFAIVQADGPIGIAVDSVSDKFPVGFGDDELHGWVDRAKRDDGLGIQVVGVVVG